MEESVPLVPKGQVRKNSGNGFQLSKRSVGLVLILIVVFGGFFKFNSYLHRISSDVDGWIYGSNISDPYSADIPYGLGHHPIIPKMISPELRAKPIPTNAWWTTLLLSDSIGQNTGSCAFTVMPYTVKSTYRGIEVSYGNTRRVVTNESIVEEYNSDIVLGANDNATEKEVVSFDSLSVTIAHKKDKHVAFNTYLVRGSPFVTVNYYETRPKLSVNGSILSINNATNLTAETSFVGERFELMVSVLGGVQHWIMYAEHPVKLQLKVNENGWDSLTFNHAYNGAIRTVLVPSNNLKTKSNLIELLDVSSKVYPISSNIQSFVKNSKSNTEFSWNTVGNKSLNLIMLANPHHVATIDRENSNVTTVLGDFGYRTMKGPATLIQGNKWLLVETLIAVGMNPHSSPSPQAVDAIKKSLVEDMTYVPAKPDPYFFGKEIARQARLILIADHIGDIEKRDIMVQKVKKYLKPWLEGSNEDCLKYEETWGGICSKIGLAGIFGMSDFGNGWYNDHHFHYGYFVYAMAVVGKYDQPFLEEYSVAIKAIVRDFANPEQNDAHFPFARYFSWFDGHSYANGVFVLDGGKSQESVSEAINAYYAVYLLGTVLEDEPLANFGQLLMSMEIRAAKTYWQMPSSSNIYEPIYAANKMTGQVAESKVLHTTWFGYFEEYIQLINMIPFTPVTDQFISKEFMQEDFPIIKSKGIMRTSPKISEEWKGYAYMSYAILNASESWDVINSLTCFDDGNSKSNALFWVATRP